MTELKCQNIKRTFLIVLIAAFVGQTNTEHQDDTPTVKIKASDLSQKYEIIYTPIIIIITLSFHYVTSHAFLCL